jgi:hypothetical protein
MRPSKELDKLVSEKALGEIALCGWDGVFTIRN